MFDIKKAIIPLPQKIEDSGERVKIASFGTVAAKIATSETGDMISEAVNLIEKKLYELTAVEACGEYRIILRTDADAPVFCAVESNEAYFIDVGENEAVLCGVSEAGTFYAAVTFCRMLYCEGDDIFVPKANIFDYPDFKYRGQFMECRYGSEFLTFGDYCDMIDYLAMMKQNTLTIGIYGCWEIQYDDRYVQYLYVPIKKYPQLKTVKNIKYYSVKKGSYVHRDNLLPTMFEEDFFGEVIAYAKKKNITVKPLFNSLGHNTLIPQVFPEISAKNENGESAEGGFCTNNEKTYDIMFDIYDEIIDRYLTPNGISDIEIGLDEVPKSYVCKCDKCINSELSEHMINYIVRVCKHLIQKGMKRIYIYHDMLYHHFNIINEDLRRRFEEAGIYDNVIIDWWSYEDPAHLFLDNTEGVNNIFHSVVKPSTGYYHWTIPTENNENIHACAALAAKLGFEGIESYSSYEHCYDKNYLVLADVAWNKGAIGKLDEFNLRYAQRYYPDNVEKAAKAFEALAYIMKDETGVMYMNRVCYYFESYFFSYRKPGEENPQAFPDLAYKRIAEDEENILSYFRLLYDNSQKALKFFESGENNGRINSIWKLTARHYYTIANEYLTLYNMNKSYNSGETEALDVIKILRKLIGEREELMLLAENVRIPATSYTYLRNMSLFRQFMTDVLEYFEKEISKGNKPEFDIFNTRKLNSRRMKFLR